MKGERERKTGHKEISKEKKQILRIRHEMRQTDREKGEQRERDRS